MKKIHLTLSIILLLLFSAFAAEGRAERRETAIWSYIALTKPINDRLAMSAQTELRTGDDNTRLYLWYFDVNARYKFTSWLAGSVGFDYIKIHSRATATRGAAWRTDWRPYISLVPSWRMGAIRANLNESLTYNWFPEMEKDGVTIKGMSYYLVRHRLTMEYPIANTRFTPLAKIEVRQTKKLERIRFTLGSLIKLSTHHSLDVGLIYQDMHNSTKTWALNCGYRIRL